VDGTYSDETGITSYRFESGGKVYMSAMGTEMEFPYTVDGNRIKIESLERGRVSVSGPHGSRVLTRAATTARS